MTRWIVPVALLVGVLSIPRSVVGNGYKSLRDKTESHVGEAPSLDIPMTIPSDQESDREDDVPSPVRSDGSMTDDEILFQGDDGDEWDSDHDTPIDDHLDHPPNNPDPGEDQDEPLELTYLAKQIQKTTQSLWALKQEPWLQDVERYLWFSGNLSPAYRVLLTAYYQGTEHVQLPSFFCAVIGGDYPLRNDDALPLCYGASFLYRPGIRDQLIDRIQRDIEPALGTLPHQVDAENVGRLLVDIFSLHDYLIILHTMVRRPLLASLGPLT